VSRAIVLWALVGWLGATMLLGRFAWFGRARLVDRLAPYAPGAAARPTAGGPPWSTARTLIGPIATMVGTSTARAVGIEEDVGIRLRRIHSPLDPARFRLRQLGHAVLATSAGVLLAVALGPPAPVVVLLVVGGPALGLLIPEHRLADRSAAWQRRLELELPVVAEQLGMLMSAGWSLPGAIDRIARRGDGSCAQDLRRVTARVGHGLTVEAALQEWAEVAGVAGVDRVVAVLALNREASDLGRLIAEEARSLRRDAHRRLIERIERKAQLVWVPVTVAALVPGTLFLVVPFLEAMRLFTS